MLIDMIPYLYQVIGKYFVFINYINKISEAHVFVDGKFMFFRILVNKMFMLFKL